MNLVKNTHKCRSCGKTPLSRDEIGLNKKLVHRELKEFFCVDCLAAYFDSDPETLLEKIAEFKRQGCTLFG